MTRRAPVRVSRVVGAAAKPTHELAAAAAVAHVVFEGVAVREVAARAVASRPKAATDRDERLAGDAPQEPGERGVPESERPPSLDVDPPARHPRPVLADETHDGLGAHEGQAGASPVREAGWGGG